MHEKLWGGFRFRDWEGRTIYTDFNFLILKCQNGSVRSRFKETKITKSLYLSYSHGEDTIYFHFSSLCCSYKKKKTGHGLLKKRIVTLVLY